MYWFIVWSLYYYIVIWIPLYFSVKLTVKDDFTIFLVGLQVLFYFSLWNVLIPWKINLWFSQYLCISIILFLGNKISFLVRKKIKERTMIRTFHKCWCLKLTLEMQLNRSYWGHRIFGSDLKHAKLNHEVLLKIGKNP